jgi:signal transduction histidine kinase/integral membrane sensor domain MASE1
MARKATQPVTDQATSGSKRPGGEVMTSSAPSSAATVATALGVGAAYYLGSTIGFVLSFPPATSSVLWPPNAILTATLLLTPPRRWWIYLLAALPAHALVELRAGFPASLVAALFATNCSEALIAAVGVRRFSDAPSRFDTLRRVTVFIVAAVLTAPFVSSFVDAAAVSWLRAEPYWLVWRTRFFSNVLTELTLVPALVMGITAGPRWLRTASPRRHLEAALLTLALVVVGLVAFAGVAGIPGLIPGSPRTPLAFVLPFFLWAAVRFGPGGVSLALLTTALLAIWAGTRGRGPFTMLPAAESVLALQIFLSVIAIPLLGLASVIEERRRTQEALEERLRFENLLARVSGAFVHLPSREMDPAIDTWLRRLGEFFEFDRLTLFRLGESEQAPAVSYAWTAPGVEALLPAVTGRDFPWALEGPHRGEPAAVWHPDGLPDAAGREGESRRRSGLTLPLVAGGRVVGGLAFVTAAGRVWSEALVQRLRLVAEVFASALSRQRMEDAVRASELMKAAILASLSSNVAVLDREGRIVAVNENWSRFGRDDGSTADAGVGVSYLDVCRQAARQGVPHAAEALAGIEAVLGGSRAAFALDFALPAPVVERWFAMSVVPLNRPGGGAIVSHTEITERKRAEMDAQRSRQELAHFTRVSTMGELAASLAHELNQPLTGILTNAQAARRFLERTPPDLDELRGILTDIVEDDKRASDVIQRLRELLRKGEPKLSHLDLNALIRDVAKLLGSDAIIRNVSVTLELDPTLPMAKGDRVQLQQVVLNLLLNAMDAMSDGVDGDRTVLVRTRNTEVQTLHVSVQDAGSGLRDGAHDLVFEPFYTTKPAGMGMGLAIARSIIEAHGGVIWAANNPARGATFHFALPVAGSPAA